MARLFLAALTLLVCVSGVMMQAPRCLECHYDYAVPGDSTAVLDCFNLTNPTSIEQSCGSDMDYICQVVSRFSSDMKDWQSVNRRCIVRENCVGGCVTQDDETELCTECCDGAFCNTGDGNGVSALTFNLAILILAVGTSVVKLI